MSDRAEHEQEAPTSRSTVKVRHEGRVVAAAEITTPGGPHGTARVSLGTPHTDAAREVRGELVDEVLDRPEVQDCDSLHVVLPIGDSASIGRLQERTTGLTARAAGASSIVDADVARPDADG